MRKYLQNWKYPFIHIYRSAWLFARYFNFAYYYGATDTYRRDAVPSELDAVDKADDARAFVAWIDEIRREWGIIEEKGCQSIGTGSGFFD